MEAKNLIEVLFLTWDIKTNNNIKNDMPNKLKVIEEENITEILCY